MTEELFRDDSYLKSCICVITGIEDKAIEVDKSVFYPLGGGQPGDTGSVLCADGQRLNIEDTKKDRETGRQWHFLSETPVLNIGDTVTLELDWERRHRLMRLHSCLHLLCSLIDAPVTGGSIQVDRARLDFDLSEPIDKEPVTEQLNELIRRNAAASMRLISNAELDAQPELVRTMSVQPPRNAAGTIRLVSFDGIDLQPCGGTHIANTGEIGAVRVKKIEKKGKQNRRITIVFDE
ncbi:MAG: alanyl-tRNA editing protein [Granulosicoccus sp.]